MRIVLAGVALLLGACAAAAPSGGAGQTHVCVPTPYGLAECSPMR